MPQSCVRINPHKWVDENSQGEEHALLVTVERPRSHDIFSTKNVVFLGPLGLEEGGIPLRTLTIRPGNRDVAAKSDAASGHSFHVNTTTFYAHYASNEGLVAAQFEILWQFQRFTRNEKIPGMSNELRDRILTLDGSSTPPRTAYDERNHRYVYQGWKRAHFQRFWEEYRMFKETALVFWRHMKFVHNEKVDWRKLNPPRPLTETEKKEFKQETNPKSTSDPSNPSKLDMTLEELVSKSQSPKKSPLRRTRNAGITKDRTPPPTRAAYNGSPRKEGLGNSPTSMMAEDPTSRSKDIFGRSRANRFSRRPQDNRRGISQPNRIRNHQAPLTENNIRCFNALTGFDSHNASQPRSPPPEEPYTLGLVDTNKGHLVEKYLKDQESEEDYTPMDLDG